MKGKAMEKRFFQLSRAVFALSVFLCMVSPAYSADYIYNLGTLGGSSTGYAVNSSGQVAGYSMIGSDQYAFIYSGGQMYDLGNMGEAYTTANAINSNGHLTGFGEDADGLMHAFVYTGIPGSGGTMIDLGFPDGVWMTEGQDINDNGQVTGTIYYDAGDDRAYRYDGPAGSGAYVNLGTLPGGTHSYGNGINNHGQVVGDAIVSGSRHAFLYTGTPGDGGQMYDLGTLGGSYVTATAINDSGQIVGASNYDTSGHNHAFLYTGTPDDGGQMYDLGTLGEAESSSSAHDINSTGQIVGNSMITGSFMFHAFLYTGTPDDGGQMIDLDAWLDTVNPEQGSHWTLYSAYGISDNGWITGEGLHDGNVRAYLLDASALIPEPASMMLFALGGAVIFCRRH
jgi:probable HAF family extracellular repeat protein